MLSLPESDITPGQDRIENHEGWPFRDLGDLIRPHDRFDIKGSEAAREQDEIRRLGGKQRGLVSAWGRVDDDEVGPTLLRRPEKLLKHLRVIAHDLGFGIAPDTKSRKPEPIPREPSLLSLGVAAPSSPRQVLVNETWY